ncbi:unnamed protein product, partial [Adineta steineri]
ATLLAGAHFYISYRGSAWRAVDSPQQNNLYWSIVCFIDLRLRPDGIINTPPEANVVSPQYAIVNRTTQIQIPVSDVNAGDDLRCRWSVYVPGHRRRRQSNHLLVWARIVPTLWVVVRLCQQLQQEQHQQRRPQPRQKQHRQRRPQPRRRQHRRRRHQQPHRQQYRRRRHRRRRHQQQHPQQRRQQRQP